MSWKIIGDLFLATSLVFALVIFIRANVNYLPYEEDEDDSS